MSNTQSDFSRLYFKTMWERLKPEEQQEIALDLSPVGWEKIAQALPAEEQMKFVQALPLEIRLAGLTLDHIREYLGRPIANLPANPRKPRRK